MAETEKQHRITLQRIARRVVLERGLLPDFSAEALAELATIEAPAVAGEHDASLDSAEAFREFFGDTRYTFGHKGVHFIAIDNVSDPRGMVGDAQLEWLAANLKNRKNHTYHSPHSQTVIRSLSSMGLDHTRRCKSS
jgi:hypothetical protein